MPVLPTARLRFGPFELDVQSAELFKFGQKLKLQGQPIQILSILLDKPGALVTREELRQRLWPAETATFVDFEHGLNTSIRKLRAALGDEAETPQYIETLPRQGYRFISPVTAAPAGLQPQTPAANRLRWRMVMACCSLALLLIVITSYLFLRQSNKPVSPERKVTIAVLPFENLSRDPSGGFFSDGMTHEMINWLGRLDPHLLGVIAATSVMKYKNSPKKISEIGNELGADYVMEGSVQLEGDRVRATVQLIAVKNQAHVWAESYDRDRSDMLLTQADIARAVTQQIRLNLTPQAQQQLSGVRRVKPDAYLDYLRGQVAGQSFTPEAMAKEQAYYERALQEDPNFAPAYAGLASCYLNYMITRRLPPSEAAKRTKEFVTKALQLDENLGEAYGVLAYTNWRYDWEVQAADRNFQRALELSPNSRRIHGRHIDYLAWRGQRAEALAEWAIERQLDPVRLESEVHSGLVYFQTREYGLMLDDMHKYVGSNPGHWLGRKLLAVAYMGLGQPLLAIPEYQKAVEYSGNDTDPMAGLAYAYARTGKRPEAEKILRNLLEQSKTSYVSPYMIATIYAGLHDNERVFEYLEKAYAERSPDLSYFLKADLRMDSLRSDRRFQDLAKRMGFPP